MAKRTILRGRLIVISRQNTPTKTRVNLLIGVTVTESWTTNNVLGLKVECDNIITPGVKMDLDASMMPEKGNQNLKAGLQVKNNHLFSRSTLDLFKGPTIVSDLVVG